tara:strand:+ start:584 stop:1063 length:480 start_codon:yes stop_codon:yes gene_type:complete
MKRFLLLLIIGLSAPALADLGEAETAMSQKSTFDIWCGSSENNCKVSFEGDRLKVNGGEGITSDQILRTDQTWKANFWSGGTYTFTITYRKKNGTNSFGKFLIRHVPTANAFTDQLSTFTGQYVGGTDPATAAAKKGADAQRTGTMLKGVQMIQQGLAQ